MCHADAYENAIVKLTIITVCRNEESSIADTIENVIAQRFVNYEYIIVDGGSTDGTVETIEKYRHRIAKFVSEPDRGIWHGMNKGIGMAEGEYVYFINAGDRFYAEDTLQRVFDTGVDDADFIYGDIVDQYPDRRHLKTFPDRITIRYLLGNMICHQATFARRELFLKYGSFDEQYRFVADYDFLWRCVIKYSVSYRHLAFPIAYYDTQGFTSDPSNRDRLVAEWNAVHRAYIPLFARFYINYLNPVLTKYDFPPFRIASKLLSRVARID